MPFTNRGLCRIAIFGKLIFESMSKENRPDKNGFLLYKTQWEPIMELENEELGMLLRAIFEYQISEQEPPRNSPISAYFKFFKAQNISIELLKKKIKLLPVKRISWSWFNSGRNNNLLFKK